MPVVGKSVESLSIDFNGSTATTTTFRVGPVSTVIKRLVISTDADVYLNFDADADDTCFVLTPGCGQFPIDNIPFTTLSVLGVNGGGTVYVLAIRG